jgi:FkbM family methyltransferase
LVVVLPLSERVNGVLDRLGDRFLAFKPRIVTLPLGDPPLRFFVGTPQAASWYDPVQPHNLAEFAWISRHLAGRREQIVDAGAYHGLYTLVLARAAAAGSNVVAVDPVAWNCALIEVNLALNGISARIEQAAVSDQDGRVRFGGGSCGRIVSSGGAEHPARRLASILPEATVVKLDIEGMEFSVFPGVLDDLPKVHTWLVEIHPGRGREPALILDVLRDRGYQLHWLNRSTARVEPWAAGATWSERTSLIALR